MRVLVTGGSGFLGQAIITALQASHPDWTISNLDLLPPKEPQHNVSFIKSDITDTPFITKSIHDFHPDAIIHTAGWVPQGSLRYSDSASLRSKVFAINYQGTLNVLEAAKASANCKAFVYTSSCTVISDDQDHDYPNMTEDLPTGRATLAYGSSKAPAEAAVLAANANKEGGLATCALRPATIIGPGDSYGVIAAIHTCIANKETPWIIGTGDNLYDFVYITNVADAHILALENLLYFFSTSISTPSTDKEVKQKFTEPAAGHAMFVSNQQPIYFRDFMLAIWAHFDHYPPFQFTIPAPVAWWAGLAAETKTWLMGAGDVALSRGSVKDAVGTRYASNDKVRRVLGYHPKVDFVDAVRFACEDYRRVLMERERPAGGDGGVNK